jgi:hypothetical protein
LGLTAVTPALTSSMVAPAATCSSASLRTVSKLPSTISAASFLRPVGLIRSPITQKGWSKPMAISLVADATTVRVMSLSFLFQRPDGTCPFKAILAGRVSHACFLVRHTSWSTLPNSASALFHTFSLYIKKVLYKGIVMS